MSANRELSAIKIIFYVGKQLLDQGFLWRMLEFISEKPGLDLHVARLDTLKESRAGFADWYEETIQFTHRHSLLEVIEQRIVTIFPTMVICYLALEANSTRQVRSESREIIIYLCFCPGLLTKNPDARYFFHQVAWQFSGLLMQAGCLTDQATIRIGKWFLLHLLPQFLQKRP